MTTFYTPFRLYQFNKLPIGNGMGCQGHSQVVDHMVADLKGKCVFNFTDNLVVYSLSVSEQFRQVLRRQQSMGFTLNRHKLVLGASEIKYLEYYLSSRGVGGFPRRWN